MKGAFSDVQMKRMTDYVATLGAGKTFKDVIANPCGLVAKTFFNGTERLLL